MSNIEPGIVDPGKPSVPPGGLPPAVDPESDVVDNDDIQEPGEEDIRPIEPDPEEANDATPVIRT